MHNATPRLWNRNFTILTVGQVISLFANAIIRFALPLHIFLVSGSAELMGRVLAISLIPMAVVSPFGGVLADRASKKRIIVVLDFLTAGLALAALAAMSEVSIVPLAVVALLVFSTIKSFMTAATDAAVPFLVPEAQLLRANSVTMTINMLSLLLGPAFGGLLLSTFGLEAILLVSGGLLAAAAIMETMMTIPRTVIESVGSPIRDTARDLAQGFRYAFHTEGSIAWMMLVILLVQLIAPGVGFIGVPVLIVNDLGMDASMVGVSQGVAAIGGLVGGLVAAALGERLRVQLGHRVLLLAGLALAPLGLAIAFGLPPVIAFVAITAGTLVTFGAIAIFTVQVMTFVQSATPPELLGRMMGLVMLAALVSSPIGSWLIAFLFERFSHQTPVILFGAAALIVAIAGGSRAFFKKLPPTVPV